MVRLWCIAIGLVCLATVDAAEPVEHVTLETVRALVTRNEALIDPIKMVYTIKMSRANEGPRPTGGRGSRTGRRYSHVNCIWAHADGKHYARQDSFYGPNELDRSQVKVLGIESVTEASLPDLAEGTIGPKYSHDWYVVQITKLGLRPFEGLHKLSEVLVPECASIHPEKEIVDGREAYVVDVRRPSAHSYFARIWIDCRRGTALRIHYYNWHPTWSGARLMSDITGIKLQRLPNGGWIPVEGVRTIHFQDGDSYEHMSVDIDSITTRRQEIPPSLFELDFPAGARIYNASTGLTTVQGQSLKTYEQVVAAGDPHIAGVVVDAVGNPVPDVVVAVVAIKQGTGFQLVSTYERPCATTDNRGRFAIEAKDEGTYALQVCPQTFADRHVRDVRADGQPVTITLQRGGIVTGQVICTVMGERVPVSNAGVTVEPMDRRVTVTVRHHLMQTTADAEGRFEIRHLPTTVRQRDPDAPGGFRDVPLAWDVRCGAVSTRVVFAGDGTTQAVELVLKPDVRAAPSLVGRVLPALEDLGIDVRPDEIEGRKVLVCFFDMNQRPARHCVAELNERAQTFREKGIRILAIQVGAIDAEAFAEWMKTLDIRFPISVIEADMEDARHVWAVRSLPWLVLTDANHMVQAEGIDPDALDEEI